MAYSTMMWFVTRGSRFSRAVLGASLPDSGRLLGAGNSHPTCRPATLEAEHRNLDLRTAQSTGWECLCRISRVHHGLSYAARRDNNSSFDEPEL